MEKRIYLDNAATTPVDLAVQKAMEPFWQDRFGNPGGLYQEGRDARRAIDDARGKIADLIGSSSAEITFTGSGTESNNLAIFGVADSVSGSNKKPHIITTKFEHESVLEPCKELEKSGLPAGRQGFDVTYLPVGKEGVVDPKDIKAALKPETVLVSIMYANNEIGTIQPIAEIAKILKDKKVLFHTDACQAGQYLDIDVGGLGVDLMSINGSKIYGPKGVGLLYIKKGIKLKPIIYGGGQEKGLRSGTENVANIVGLAKALEIARDECEEESKRLIKLRDYLKEEIFKNIPEVELNGDPKKRLPNNLNVSFPRAEGEAIILYLDEKGVACSTGSACTSENFDPSHVIVSLGKPHGVAHSSVRFSLGRSTTKEDIGYLLKILPDIISKLRGISAIN